MEIRVVTVQHEGVDTASMGPRSFGRGDTGTVPSGTPDIAASMGPRSFGRGDRTAGDTCEFIHGGFNGATVFRPWRCISKEAAESKTDLLQWGHGLSAVEI